MKHSPCRKQVFYFVVSRCETLVYQWYRSVLHFIFILFVFVVVVYRSIQALYLCLFDRLTSKRESRNSVNTTLQSKRLHHHQRRMTHTQYPLIVYFLIQILHFCRGVVLVSKERVGTCHLRIRHVAPRIKTVISALDVAYMQATIIIILV
jgi:hypothetical protein